MTIKQL